MFLSPILTVTTVWNTRETVDTHAFHYINYKTITMVTHGSTNIKCQQNNEANR